MQVGDANTDSIYTHPRLTSICPVIVAVIIIIDIMITMICFEQVHDKRSVAQLFHYLSILWPQ